VANAPYRALLVDDNVSTLRLLSRAFERRGWEIRSAASIQEACESLTPTPDAVILDLGLPDGDGETVLRKIRMERIPIEIAIIVTGKPPPGRLDQLTELQPDLIVVKPIDPEILLRYCESGLQGSFRTRALFAEESSR
jgi:CheY-like chemotaxis protein